MTEITNQKIVVGPQKSSRQTIDATPPAMWGPHTVGAELVIAQTEEEVRSAIHALQEDVKKRTNNDILSGSIALDAETDENDGFVGIGLCANRARCFYISQLTDDLSRFIRSVGLVGHNFKGDCHWLRSWGIPLRSTQIRFDTRLAAYVENCTRESGALKVLGKEILGFNWPTYKQMTHPVVKMKAEELPNYLYAWKPNETKLSPKKVTLDKLPVELVANYCGMDVLTTWILAEHYACQKAA